MSDFELMAAAILAAGGVFVLLLHPKNRISFLFVGYANGASLAIGSLVWDRINQQGNTGASYLLLAALVALCTGPAVRRAVAAVVRFPHATTLRLVTLAQGRSNRLTFNTVLLLSLIALAVHFRLSGIPLLADNVNYAKVDAFSGVGLVLIRFLRVMLPLLLLQATVYHLGCLHRYTSWRHAAFVMACAFLSFMTGFKGYFPYYFVTPLVITYSAFGRLSLRRVLLVSAVLLLVVSVYAAFVERLNWLAGISYVFARLTLGNSQGPYFIINALVPEHGYFFGETFVWDLGWFLARLHLISFDHQNFAAHVFTLIQGDNPLNQQSVTSVAGEAFANYGTWAMLGTVCVWGALLDWLSQLVTTMDKDPVAFPYVVIAGAHLANLLATGPVIYNTLDLVVSFVMMGSIYLAAYIAFSLPIGTVRLTSWKLRLGPQSRASKYGPSPSQPYVTHS